MSETPHDPNQGKQQFEINISELTHGRVRGLTHEIGCSTADLMQQAMRMLHGMLGSEHRDDPNYDAAKQLTIDWLRIEYDRDRAYNIGSLGASLAIAYPVTEEYGQQVEVVNFNNEFTQNELVEASIMLYQHYYSELLT